LGSFVAPQYALSAEQTLVQVCNEAIADAGQWIIEQHLNYAGRGQTTPVSIVSYLRRRMHVLRTQDMETIGRSKISDMNILQLKTYSSMQLERFDR